VMRAMAMSELLLQFGLVAAFGTLCFGCGCPTAFIVTRNQWRSDMTSAVLPTATSGPASGNGESKQVGASRPCLPLARPWQNDLAPPLPTTLVRRRRSYAFIHWRQAVNKAALSI